MQCRCSRRGLKPPRGLGALERRRCFLPRCSRRGLKPPADTGEYENRYMSLKRYGNIRESLRVLEKIRKYTRIFSCPAPAAVGSAAVAGLLRWALGTITGCFFAPCRCRFGCRRWALRRASASSLGRITPGPSACTSPGATAPGSHAVDMCNIMQEVLACDGI